MKVKLLTILILTLLLPVGMAHAEAGGVQASPTDPGWDPQAGGAMQPEDPGAGILAATVWVDDDTYDAATCTAAGHTWGTDCTNTVQGGISLVDSGGTIYVAAGTYVETGQIAIAKNLSIVGEARATTIIKPNQSTDSSGDGRGWWLVGTGYTFNLSGVTLDGQGWDIHQAIRSFGSGTIDDVVIQNMVYPGYQGMGVVLFGNMTVSDSTFANMGRIGVIAFGAGSTSSIISGNTFTGKGNGTWLDYGVEVGGGAQATISGNTISGNTGLASDGSISAGILVTTYYGAGTEATITGNVLTNNTDGVAIGYGTSDTSVVVAYDNSIYANANYGIGSTTGPSVDASGNWWGSADAATVKAAANEGSVVDYTPWLASGTNSAPAPGFQGDFSTLWVDDDSPQTGTTGRIQEGIDLVSGSTVYVAAGTYVEDPVIDKAVTLLGPNAAINPNTGTRVAEAVILPAYSAPDPAVCEVMVYIEVSDVTIKGFTFDGDNPALTSGVMIDGADVDACEILAGWEGMGNIVVENNILKHSTYTGIDFYNYTNAAATAGNYIRYNRFEDIGETTYGWGIGILIYNNFYADITDNVLEGVRTGIQTGNFYSANPGTTGSISNNQIGVWRLGIFHNLAYSNASPFTISGNIITAETYPGATKWNGLLLSSISSPVNATITNNTITIPDTVSFAPPGYTAGYNVWNVTTSAPIAISGGTVTGGDYGVFVNNWEGYNSNAGNTAITIDGVTVLDSNIAGVYVKDSPSNTNDATVYADIQNCTIDTDATGVLIEGEDATADAYHNRLGGNTTYGMNNMVVGVLTNAEQNYWGSVLPAEVAAEVTGDVDFQPWCNYDFTVCDYVFPVHNLTQLIDYPTIQSAVDDADPGDVIEADAGTYVEQAVIDKDLTLQGASIDAIIQAPTSVPTCFTTSSGNHHPIVCIKDDAVVTIDGFTIDGAGRGNANSKFEGVAFRNAGGTLENCVIKDIRDTPFSGAQHGVAIYAYNDDLASRTINVWDNEIYGFQKNAMALNSADDTPLEVDVQRNVITGAGTTTVTAQNGIQVLGDLNSGIVAENIIDDIAWSGTYWVSCDVLNYYADLDILDNTITNVQVGIYNIDGSGDITGNEVTVLDVGDYSYGILATDPPQAIPSPYGAEETLGPERSVTRPEATLAVDASGNTVTFVGADNTSTYGIEADAGYGPNDIAFTANGNTVTGFYVGIEIWNCQSSCDTGVFTSITANNNCLSDNTYGMRSNVTYRNADGTNNWWGDASGPYHPTENAGGLGDAVSDYVLFDPWLDDCGGDPTSNFQNARTGLVYGTLQSAVDAASPNDTIIPIGPGPFGPEGHATVPPAKYGLTIMLLDRTFGPGSPWLVVNADDVTVLGPGMIDGWDGSANSLDPAIRVLAGADNFILKGAEIQRWASGVSLEGSVLSFKIGENFIHNNTGAGLVVGSGVTLSGVVTIEGNLFKDNGGSGVEHNGNGTLPAAYNSWGDLAGPAGPLGDGVGSDVTYIPWTFAEIFLDMYPDTEAVVHHVVETTSFDVALKADAAKLYGVVFRFSYDNTKLTLNSTTFSAPWAGRCTVLPVLDPDEIGYFCSLLNEVPPDPEWDADGGTIATFSFTAFSGTPGNGPWTALFDISPLEFDTEASAIGGQKVFVNNAGFNDPTASQRDITDGDDGQIIIERVANYTGLVDLQGRYNDGLAVCRVYNQSAKAGAVELANGTTNSSGSYTTAHIAPNWLSYGSTYYLIIDRWLFLPTTPSSGLTFLHSRLLDTYPLTPLPTVFLLGGDATNDERISVHDLACIGGDYGRTSGFNLCGGPGLSDVNEDGRVSVHDLSLAGGNLYKTFSPWTVP